MLEDKERPGQPKQFEDEELKSLHYVDEWQMLQELSQSLGVDELEVNNRLKAIVLEIFRMWTDPRTPKTKGFLTLWMAKKSGFITKRIKSHGFSTDRHQESKECLWYYALCFCVIYFELLKPNETIKGNAIGLNLCVWVADWRNTKKGTTKCFCSMKTLGHMLQNRSGPFDWNMSFQRTSHCILMPRKSRVSNYSKTYTTQSYRWHFRIYEPLGQWTRLRLVCIKSVLVKSID